MGERVPIADAWASVLPQAGWCRVAAYSARQPDGTRILYVHERSLIEEPLATELARKIAQAGEIDLDHWVCEGPVNLNY